LKNSEGRGNGMLQNVVEYLIQNPEEKAKIIEGSASLIGLTRIEQKAVLDVFKNSDTNIIDPLQYW
jgi:competence protein ComX